MIGDGEIHNRIRTLFFDVLKRAWLWGLSTDNIEIHLNSKLADELKLGDFLTIDYPGRNVKLFHVPVIRDDTIPEIKKGNSAMSDIKIYSPDWIVTENDK